VRGNDNFVAVVDNNILKFKPIKVASTDGNVISVADGLQSGERIAVNLPDEVTNGSRVQPIAQRR
jgi:hypothetical protein